MPITARKLMAALTAGALVVAPTAAQANTRAGDSTSLYTSSQVQPGLGRTAEGENVGGTGDILALILVALWATGIFVIAADIGDDDNENQSPGAN